MKNAVAVANLLNPPERLKKAVQKVAWSRIHDVFTEVAGEVYGGSDSFDVSHG